MNAGKLTPEVYARAMDAAQELKARLERRLIGKIAAAARLHGESKVVAVDIPTTYENQIAIWPLWHCRMEDDKGLRWSQSLSSYIARSELYTLFRNQFAGIDVVVHHPYAELFPNSLEWVQRKFLRSGRFITVEDRNPAYVRPKGDLTNSVWLNAALYVKSESDGSPENQPLVACHINPFEPRDTDFRGRNYPVGPKDKTTFFVSIPEPGQDIFLPVARVVCAQLYGRGSVATFELDAAVEPCFER